MNEPLGPKAVDRGPDLTLANLKGLTYEVVGETVGIASSKCTCGGGSEPYGHEQYCGLDPVVIDLSDRPERMAEVVGELNWLLGQLQRALENQEPKSTKGTQVREQYGLRYGDGEIDSPYISIKAVQVEIDAHRLLIDHNRLDPSDYEPMSIVARTKTTTKTKWEEVL